MPETLDELFAAASAEIATRTRPPGAARAVSRSRRRAVGAVAAVVTAVVVGSATFAALAGDRSDGPPEPAPRPTIGIDVDDDDVPVWYDDAGLHRGDVVARTAVPLTGPLGQGGLTLVRAGALYRGETTDDVWFQPWGGEPRVIGHAEPNGGPWVGAGDPDGDNAAWFEGNQLVVFDTDAGRAIVRTAAQPASRFVDVSVDQVVWRPTGPAGMPLLRLDLATGQVAEVAHSSEDLRDPDVAGVIDLRGDVEAWAWGADEAAFCCGPATSGGVIVRSAGHGPRRYPAFISPMATISPDGRFLAGWTGDAQRAAYGGISGAGFVDVATGSFFELPGGSEHGQGASWTYGSMAMVPTLAGGDGGARALFACDVAQRACAEVVASGEVVLPD